MIDMLIWDEKMKEQVECIRNHPEHLLEMKDEGFMTLLDHTKEVFTRHASSKYAQYVEK